MWRVRTVFGLLVATLVDRHELAALVDRQPQAAAVHAASRGTARHGTARRGTPPSGRRGTALLGPRGAARHAAKWHGTARDGAARRGIAGHGIPRAPSGTAGHGSARRRARRARQAARRGTAARGARAHARPRGTKRHGAARHREARQRRGGDGTRGTEPLGASVRAHRDLGGLTRTEQPVRQTERVATAWLPVRRSAGDFLAALERAGELQRISAPVDPTLEMSEIVTRTVRDHGPALLFETPTRGDMPVAINLFGTERRMAMALGVDDVDEIGARIGEPGQAGTHAGLGRDPRRAEQADAAQVRTAEEDRSTRPAKQRVYRGAGRGSQPAARPAGLAGRRRGFPQLRPHAHEASRDRQAQPRPLPAAAAPPQHARHALADPQGLDRAPRRRRAPRPAAAGRRSRSAATRSSATPRPRRCRATSTNTCSPASCAANASRWSTA